MDHVRTLTVVLEPETGDADSASALQRMLQQPLTEPSDPPELESDLQSWLDRALVYSGAHEISVAAQVKRTVRTS